MNTDALIPAAKDLATRAHAGQVRKHSGTTFPFTPTPYIDHPQRVAAMVAKLPGATAIQIAAAWLHDVIEDCADRFIIEVGIFPSDVILLVRELTKASLNSKAKKALREAIDIEKLVNASLWARRIKLCDMICNMEDCASEGTPADFRAYCCDKYLARLDALKGTDEALEAQLREIIQQNS